ncbi:MAG: FAD-dependent oxidoreductase [Oscillospiraceae bacterium]|nr:FAD-dependent oxidoreductase [Oscillospiraceae bacterium]
MQSVWQDTKRKRRYPIYQGQKRTQVLVIGGGMAGILCAYNLQKQGKQVLLVEAERIGGGITGKTTAVLTAQHDFLYTDMAEKFGKETAQAYLRGNLAAVREFSELSLQYPCDYEEIPSVQFTVTDTDRLKAEVQTVKELGFSAEYMENPRLPVAAAAAVKYPAMAQFHPLKFIYGIAEELEIYEQSRVLQLEGTTALLEGGTICAEQVVVTTHFPFINRYGWYFTKLYQNRSYVLALENAPNPGATLAELEGQGIYMRPYGDLLLLGGGDHRTGKNGGGFDFLRDYAKKHFPEAKEKYAWANQDCMSLDGLPYVGAYSPNLPDVYVAAGFNAWGMTNSMVSAKIITDQILGRSNPLSKAFQPNRSVVHKQLFSNLGTTLADYVSPTVKRCPHLGCALKWNKLEHSWDCPCHGSRFDEDGALLDTPAQKDANI